MKKISFFSHSFQGRRKNNEDNCISIRLNSENVLLAVADGMGGAAAGEVASKIAIDVLQTHLKNQLEDINSKSDFKGILTEAYAEIQRAIKKQIEEKPAYQGMGTTLSVIWFYKQSYVWANLGDSRIYFLTENIIKQITKDHTYIQDFKDKHGTEVPSHIAAQYGNYIMRSLDGGKDEPDLFPLNKPSEELKTDSAFLLCSDGLILDKLDNLNKGLHSLFLAGKTLENATKALINFAYEKGSTDNITVVLGEYGKVKRKLLKKKASRKLWIIPLLIIALLSVLYFLKPEIISLQKNPFGDKTSNDSTVIEERNNEKTIKQTKTFYPKFKPFSWTLSYPNKKVSEEDIISFESYKPDSLVQNYIISFYNEQEEWLGEHKTKGSITSITLNDKEYKFIDKKDTYIVKVSVNLGDTILPGEKARVYKIDP